MTTTKLNVIPRQENGLMRGLILSGRAGIGKTACLMGMVSEGEIFVRIPMASRTAEDFGVYPVPDRQSVKDENGVETSHFFTIAQPLIEAQLIPLLKENIGNGYGVLLLDDVTLADPRLQSGLLELVQFGRIGDFQLGPNVLIAMTGNGIEDGCSAVEWNKALLGRSMFVEYEPDFTAWLEYDCNKELDTTVIGFLKENEGFFAPSADDSQYSDANGKTPSPRDWTSLGLEMHKCNGIKNYVPSMLWPSVASFATSMCGKQAGRAYKVFTDLMLEYPSSEELLKNPDEWMKLTPEQRNKIGCVFAVATSLRRTVVRMNEKINEKFAGKMQGEPARAAKSELVKNFCYATARLMTGRREMGAFVLREVMSKLMESNAGRSDAQKDPMGAIIAAYCYNLKDVNDPVMKDAQFGKVIEDIKAMSKIGA